MTKNGKSYYRKTSTSTESCQQHFSTPLRGLLLVSKARKACCTYISGHKAQETDKMVGKYAGQGRTLGVAWLIATDAESCTQN